MNDLHTNFDRNPKKKPSTYFSEIVTRELASTRYEEYVRDNVTKILSLLTKESDTPIATFWEEFHEKYRAVPDLFPERGIFRGIFAIPIGGIVSEKSLQIRGEVLALFLQKDFSIEWEFLEKCYIQDQ